MVTTFLHQQCDWVRSIAKLVMVTAEMMMAVVAVLYHTHVQTHRLTPHVDRESVRERERERQRESESERESCTHTYTHTHTHIYIYIQVYIYIYIYTAV